MSDDLVKELRFWNGGHKSDDKMERAADRIEALEAANLKQSLITVDHLSRIEALEAALQSVLKYQLTDETWIELGLDPKIIRADFDAARAALAGEKKDE